MNLLFPFSCCLLLLTSSCVHAGAHKSASSAQEPSADALFARERFAEAASRYAQEIQDAPRSHSGSGAASHARARFFRALALFAQDDPANKRRAESELRSLEHELGTTTWGVLARLFLKEMARGTVLREALLQAGVELHTLEQNLSQLNREHSEALTTQKEQEQALNSLREERLKLQVQLKEAQERVSDLTERVNELDEELSALKRIDMQRQP